MDIDGDSFQEQECTYSDGPHIPVCGDSGGSDTGLLLQPGLDPRGQQAQGEGLSVGNGSTVNCLETLENQW